VEGILEFSSSQPRLKMTSYEELSTERFHFIPSIHLSELEELLGDKQTDNPTTLFFELEVEAMFPKLFVSVRDAFAQEMINSLIAQALKYYIIV